ncbi:MAG: peptidylprolyl isomerase [Bacteroidetes bacterium]|nr:peptidylprolyl isomerase [Bacteroidota bacterium]
MVIDENKVVTLHYKLQRDNENGELVEETFGSKPLVFLYGTGQMLPEFEKQLAAKAVGEEVAFGLKSTDAYGEYNPEAVVSVPKAALGIESEADAEKILVVGNTLPLRDQQGRNFTGIVKEVDPQNVTLDLNHPMAGVDLYFSVKVEDVRPATESELEHGHVHGPGGHQH